MKIEQKSVSLHKNMKTMNKFYTIFAFLLLFVSCKSHEDEQETINRRTVIVYMSGENSLSSNVYSDLAEMKQASLSLKDDERLVAFVDHTSLPYIVEMKEGRCDTLRTFNEDFYACDPEAFYEIIRWIEEQCPAQDDNYGLVLWGHATGWLVSRDTIATAASRPRKAYGQDLGTNQTYGLGSKWMNITQMSKALERLPKFRYILADCCCFLTAESAYELRNVTSYLIGSPAEIPAPGAPYHLIVSSLFSESPDFYKALVDTYFDYYTDYFNNSSEAQRDYPYVVGYSVPLAVVDMSQMEGLAQATRNLLMAPADYVMDSLPYYYHRDLPCLYDFGGVMKRHLSAADYQAWRIALEKAVPYKRFSARWISMYRNLKLLLANDSFLLFDDETYAGLSIHIPQAMYNFDPSYNEGFKSFEWYDTVGWKRFE